MADDALNRLRSAIGVVLERRSVGSTTEVRIKRAVAELVRGGQEAKIAALREAARAAQAAKSGYLDDSVANEVMGLVMAGWQNAAVRPVQKRAARRVGTASRTNAGRSLRNVPRGTRVFYDGVEAIIRDGRIYLPDGEHFDALTPAALHVTGQSSVNGWDAWRLADGRRLKAVYDRNEWPQV